jgi:hypothetical protein
LHARNCEGKGLGWSTKECGKRAAVGHASVSRFDDTRDVNVSTLMSLQSALKRGHVTFIPRDGIGRLGVRLRR